MSKKRKSDLNLDNLNKKLDNNMIYINHEINDINDLIYLGNQYVPGNIYNINLKKLYNLIPILTKLQKVVGMDNIKKNITNQIIYFIQDFQDKNSDMLHIVIQGPPGVGKTMLGEIIGEIYFKLDIIEQDISASIFNDETDSCDNNPINNDKKYKFTIAKRSDLIGKYLGHTAAKTQSVIDKSLGGVLFIDEAYSLGNAEGRDSFSKECIDTLNQNLTEKKNQLLVIIAGYQEALDTCFFSYNEGLRRRFPFVYTIERYEPKEMSRILHKMISDLGKDWELLVEQKVLDEFFEKNINLFKDSAGDIETLIFLIKIEHAKRVFCLEPSSNQRKKINNTDINNALKTYIENKEKKDKQNKKSDINYMMYS
jgi:SpoVK/Ycf46/Vps4 family AAA+-type ATPase